VSIQGLEARVLAKQHQYHAYCSWCQGQVDTKWEYGRAPPPSVYLMSPHDQISQASRLHRAAVFDLTGHTTSTTLSVIFRFAHKTARQETVSSTVILETQAAWSLRSTTVSIVAVAQLPCRLN